MILNGIVADNQAIIDVEIEGVTNIIKVPMIIDTGFNGELMYHKKL